MKLLENYFSKKEKMRISDLIWEAERKTSGEIRVYFERTTKGLTPETRAIEVFYKLKMENTEYRNGVLFYIAFNDRKYAIIGDSGIHEKVDNDFWDDVSHALKDHFIHGEFIEGLSAGIYEVGERLKRFFPIRSNNKNELPNEVAFEKDLIDEEE